MHNLVIDIGNTNSKIAVFEQKELLDYQVVPQIEKKVIIDLIEKFNIQNSTVSSVRKDFEEIATILKANTNYIEFSTQLNTGIKNNYKTISTLGLDRWAMIIAAHQIYPEQNCFMIDAGTCITYDLLNSRAEYFGGSISPGIYMRFEALHHFTGKLPLVKWDKEKDGIPAGSDTSTAIKNGVLQGVMNEIEGFIAFQNKNNKDLKVVITGGDATFLLKQLKNSIFAPQIIYNPYLVLKGLNEAIAFEHVQKN